MYKVIIEDLPYVKYCGKQDLTSKYGDAKDKGFFDAVKTKTEYEFETKEEAFAFYEREWRLTDFIYWIGENDKYVYACYHDEWHEVTIGLRKWKGFENDVELVYKIPKDPKKWTSDDWYSFHNPQEAYLKACETHGVEPSPDFTINFFSVDDDGCNTGARLDCKGFNVYIGYVVVEPIGKLDEKVKEMEKYAYTYERYWERNKDKIVSKEVTVDDEKVEIKTRQKVQEPVPEEEEMPF